VTAGEPPRPTADPGPTFDAVLASRRMCRDFRADPVPAATLDAVLAAAFRGPSAGNAAALDLVVLSGADTARYWDVTLPTGRRTDFRWPGLLRAPVLVVAVVDPAAYVERYGRADKTATGLGRSADAWPVPYWFVDGGAALMAMLLAAESAGLGALLFGQFDHEADVLAALGVPDGRRGLGTVALGVPAAGGRAPSASARAGRPDPAGRVHHSSW